MLLKVNIGAFHDKMIFSRQFIMKNKNKLKIINNNKIKSLGSELSIHKLNIKFLFLGSKHFFFESYKMKYKINQKEEKIKIFGKEFVEKNSTRCIILYKNEIFP